MKRGGILNQPLSDAIASLGHGDMLIVSDAGFPIPRETRRIDLALAADLPDLRTMLTLVHAEMIVERVVVAAEMEEFNPPLFDWLREAFSSVDFDLRPHEEMLSSVARSAKAVVRTGAFDPWGNIGLVSGVDAPRWFAREGVRVPDYYRERVERGRSG